MTDAAIEFARPGELRVMCKEPFSLELIVALVRNKTFSDMNHVLASNPSERVRAFFWCARDVARDKRVV